jgi:hypothetical protein
MLYTLDNCFESEHPLPFPPKLMTLLVGLNMAHIHGAPAHQLLTHPPSYPSQPTYHPPSRQQYACCGFLQLSLHCARFWLKLEPSKL